LQIAIHQSFVAVPALFYIQAVLPNRHQLRNSPPPTAICQTTNPKNPKFRGAISGQFIAPQLGEGGSAVDNSRSSRAPENSPTALALGKLIDNQFKPRRDGRIIRLFVVRASRSGYKIRMADMTRRSPKKIVAEIAALDAESPEVLAGIGIL
jgi:hypothetical protein